MKNFGIIVLISFLGISLLGLSFSDMGQNHKGGCIASSINGTACPVGKINSIEHHLSAWQDFMNILVSPILNWYSFFSFLSLLVIGVFLYYKNTIFIKSKFILKRLKDLSYNYLYSQQKITSWLSLLEFSPAIIK